jgi:hypothetical protein
MCQCFSRGQKVPRFITYVIVQNPQVFYLVPRFVACWARVAVMCSAIPCSACVTNTGVRDVATERGASYKQLKSYFQKLKRL